MTDDETVLVQAPARRQQEKQLVQPIPWASCARTLGRVAPAVPPTPATQGSQHLISHKLLRNYYETPTKFLRCSHVPTPCMTYSLHHYIICTIIPRISHQVRGGIYYFQSLLMRHEHPVCATVA